jgi:4-hydroxybenzoyl-CoA reductase subunit alpha
MMGNAAKDAAEEALEPILDAVSDELEVPAARLVARKGRIYDAENPEVGVPIEEATKLGEEKHGLIGAEASYTPPDIPGEYKGAGVGPSPAYSFSACVAQVDADPATGEIDVERVWLAHDVGKALNPMSVEGQTEGSVYMGVGEVLMEEQTFHDNGLHRGPSMLNYKSPTVHETPPVETMIVETNGDRGPYGAKEAGQGPLLPVIPAVTDAVNDALGAEFSETPITAKKVRNAIQSGREIGPDEVPDYEFSDPIQVDLPDDWTTETNH